MIDVNLTGTVLCARAATRRFTKVGAGGSIVTISSIRARKAWAGDVHTTPRKAGSRRSRERSPSNSLRSESE